MNNVLALTKIYVQQFLAKIVASFTKKKHNAFLTIFIGSIVLVGIMALVYFQFDLMFSGLAQFGMGRFIISYGLIFSAILSTIIVVTEVPSHFYKNKDYELLASLPLKNWEVVSAKTLTAYASTFFLSLIVVVPTFLVYFTYNSITVVSVVFAVLSLLFLPMFVLLLGCLLGFIVYKLTANMKNKALFSSLFMIIFVISIMAVSFISTSGDGMLLLFAGGETPLAIKIILPYIYFLNTAVFQGSALYFAYFVIVNLLYLLLAIMVISVTYNKVNSNLLTTKFKFSASPLSYEKGSPLKALFHKERKSFFGSSAWTVNVIVGPIMIVIYAVVLAVITRSNSAPTMAEQEFMLNIMNIVYLVFVCALTGMSITTNSSISMEAKSIQILKQLPVSFKTIAYAKILFNAVLVLPAIYLANIIFLAFNYINIIYAISIFVIPTISMLAFSVMGLVINLRFPKLIWKREVEVVKQSASLLVSIFSNMFVSIVPLVLFIIFTDWFLLGTNIVWFNIALLVWMLIYLFISVKLLHAKGEKMFDKVS